MPLPTRCGRRAFMRHAAARMRKRLLAMSCRHCVPIGLLELRGNDGRARLRVYVVLVVRDLLSERVVKLMAIDASRGWRGFESILPTKSAG